MIKIRKINLNDNFIDSSDNEEFSYNEESLDNEYLVNFYILMLKISNF